MCLFPTTFLEIAVYSKHKLSTILVANVTNLFRFVALTFWFKTLVKFCMYFISTYYFLIELTLWDTVTMNLAQ